MLASDVARIVIAESAAVVSPWVRGIAVWINARKAGLVNFTANHITGIYAAINSAAAVSRIACAVAACFANFRMIWRPDAALSERHVGSGRSRRNSNEARNEH